MTTYQSQSNGYVAFKAQSAKGSIASGGSGFVLRSAGGAGGKITKNVYGSNEVRRDGMRSRGRHGQRRVSGTYLVEVSLDNMDSLYEAVFQGTWANALTITEATSGGATSITTTTSTIVGNTGSWITVGLRVGDVIRLTGFATSANNSKNLRITGLTATVITVAETLVLDASADTSFTITRPGQKLICPAAGAAVKTYFTVEEYDGDLDLTEIFSDVIFHSLKFTMAPDSIMHCEVGFTGTGAFTTASAGSAPTFTSPTESTGVPLACVDATVRYSSTDFVELTSWDMMIDRGAVAPSVVGSIYAPDVFTGNMAVGMNFGMLRSDYGKMTDFLAETALTFHVLAVENESEPKDFLSLFVPNFTLGGVDKSPLSKEAGPRTQTIAIPPDLVGIDTTGAATGYDSTMVKLMVSNT
jgi:hypothetical protein